jgi:hypothetical protein
MKNQLHVSQLIPGRSSTIDPFNGALQQLTFKLWYQI